MTLPDLIALAKKAIAEPKDQPGGCWPSDARIALAALSPEFVIALAEVAEAAKDHMEIDSLGSYSNLVDALSRMSALNNEEKEKS